MDFLKQHPFQDVFVAVILSLLFIIIKLMRSRYLHKINSRSKIEINYGALGMGIHYDYKSTRGDKAMKKEAKRKARIEQRRAKRSNNSPNQKKKERCTILISPLHLRI